jgi:hypothetical protein
MVRTFGGSVDGAIQHVKIGVVVGLKRSMNYGRYFSAI